MSGDVGAVDPTLLGTSSLQEQNCNTDYVIIPNPSQGGAPLNTGSDRFCGLGLATTTSKLFVLFIVLIFSRHIECRFFCRSYKAVCRVCSGRFKRNYGYCKSWLFLVLFAKYMSGRIEFLVK